MPTTRARMWMRAKRSGRLRSFPRPGLGSMGERPAITMTHYAAETFCQWLSKRRARSCKPLPTEAEWEYAARGGTSYAVLLRG